MTTTKLNYITIMTEEQRLAVIKHAVENSRKVSPTKSIEDFLEEVKSEQLFSEHGLLEPQKVDYEDEASLLTYDPSAEKLDEEDQLMGISDEMKGVY
mgnify:CR=1 FL=1|jgi:hypothetical protein